MLETKIIEGYSLYEFCQKVQEAIQQGYVFDFDSNANFPTAFGSLLVAGMVKQPEEKKEVDEAVKTKPARVSTKKVVESN